MRQQEVSVGVAAAGHADAPPAGDRMPDAAGPDGDKLTLTPLGRFRIPVGGQEIELQQVDYVHGGISLLRLRIREGRRFTVFDMDPVTARYWGELFSRWAEAQPSARETLEKT